MFVKILATLALELAVTQRPYLGECPTNVKTMDDFDVQQFVGRWYEHSRYPNILEKSERCNSGNCELQENGELFVNVSSFALFNTQDEWTFKAYDNGHGNLHAIFDPITAFLGFFDFRILGTDYTNYTVVYSCYGSSFMHFKFVWILTRQRTINEEVLQDAHAVLAKNGLSVDPLIEIDHEDCDTSDNELYNDYYGYENEYP